MPRTVTTTTTVYSFDELSEKAKEKAKEEIYNVLSDSGVITESLRSIAAYELYDEGWAELADLRDGTDSDTKVLQFGISHSQGDFVMWSAHREWEHQGRKVTVKTEMRRNAMDVEILGAEDMAEGDFDRLFNAAVSMVRARAGALVSKLATSDMEYGEDTEYLADYATANELDFTEDGAIFR